MTVNHTFEINQVPPVLNPAILQPVSNPPGYEFDFKGSAARMHKWGHIWFNGDPKGITIRLEITTPGYVFANDGVTNDGSLALFISDDPAAKQAFNSFGGVFSPPTLNLGAPAYTQLTFTAANSDGEIYFYQLNCVELASGSVIGWDPIIVNKGY